MIRFVRAAALASALLFAGCSGEGAPVTAPPEASPARVDGSRPTVGFVHRAADAPSFSGEVVGLDAVAGRAGEVTLRFADGSPYATFRVAPETLRGATLRGEPIPAGTVVRISMRAVDPQRFVVDLQPSGILFNPHAPAELEFAFRHAAPERAPGRFSVWRQESPGEPWHRVDPVSEDPQAKTLRAKLYGFTRYALATGH